MNSFPGSCPHEPEFQKIHDNIGVSPTSYKIPYSRIRIEIPLMFSFQKNNYLFLYCMIFYELINRLPVNDSSRCGL